MPLTIPTLAYKEKQNESKPSTEPYLFGYLFVQPSRIWVHPDRHLGRSACVLYVRSHRHILARVPSA